MGSDDEKVLSALKHRFLERSRAPLGIAGKMGVGTLRRALGSKSGFSATDVSKLVESLGELKGLATKFGQVLSYVPGTIPPELQEAFTQLQKQTVSMDSGVISRLFEEEFGCLPGAAFETFEKTPFAAASIGQVHRARLDSREVVVKIQYPEIEQAIATDLRSISGLVSVAKIFMPVGAEELVDELRDRVLEECDYGREARNQQLFASILEGEPGAHVPSVVPQWCSGRVLTSEYVQGMDLYEFVDAVDGPVRNRAAATIFRTCFHSLFARAVYNADPHPGNYLFDRGGDVTFLDFGCVRRFEGQMIETWKHASLAYMDGDWKGFREAYVELGWVPNPDRFDWEYQREMMKYVYRPFTERNPWFTYSQEYVRESYDVLVYKNPNRFRLRMPREWLFLNRLQWGLASVLALLGAQADWPGMWREALESPLDPVAPDVSDLA